MLFLSAPATCYAVLSAFAFAAALGGSCPAGASCDITSLAGSHKYWLTVSWLWAVPTAGSRSLPREGQHTEWGGAGEGTASVTRRLVESESLLIWLLSLGN